MFLDFSVGNFRSFNSIQKLNFRATSLISECKQVDTNNIFTTPQGGILKTIGLYGPNGSGKSNLLKGLSIFSSLVDQSLESETIMDQASEPFQLKVKADDHAGFFQLNLLLGNKKYRYGFTLKETGAVQQEWLFGPAEQNETWYFKRTEQQIDVNKEWFDEASSLPKENLRVNTLFLTFVSSYNGDISQKIRQLIVRDMAFDGVTGGRTTGFSRENNRAIRFNSTNGLTNQLVKTGNEGMVLERLRRAGLSYDGIRVLRESSFYREKVLLKKNVLDKNGNVLQTVQLDLDENESAGTKKFYSFIGVLDRLFEEGGVLVSDEIDNNFHPSLLRQFVGLFNNPAINVAGAQLLFTSHDTNLLDPDILRRDQIYFTEKSKDEETILYSLADLRGIRNNADFARQYLAGFYGALPILENYKQA